MENEPVSSWSWHVVSYLTGTKDHTNHFKNISDLMQNHQGEANICSNKKETEIDIYRNHTSMKLQLFHILFHRNLVQFNLVWAASNLWTLDLPGLRPGCDIDTGNVGHHGLTGLPGEFTGKPWIDQPHMIKYGDIFWELWPPMTSETSEYLSSNIAKRMRWTFWQKHPKSRSLASLSLSSSVVSGHPGRPHFQTHP